MQSVQLPDSNTPDLCLTNLDILLSESRADLGVHRCYVHPDMTPVNSTIYIFCDVL